MADRFILIAGYEHSGTTFTAETLMALNRWDFGGELHWKYPEHGAEHAPLGKLFAQMEKTHEDSLENLLTRREDLHHTYRHDVQQISEDLPEMVKEPRLTRYLDWWIRSGGRRPDHVIVSFRPVNLVAQSINYQPSDWVPQAKIYGGYGLLLEALIMNQIPASFTAFPNSAKSARYMYDCLLPFLGPEEVSYGDFMVAHEATANLERVHYGLERDNEEAEWSSAAG